MQIVIATNNNGKKIEFQELFSEQNITIRSLSDFPEIPDPPETHTSFDQNAKQKAEFVFQRIESTLPTIVIADDSGLCVEALHGAPGVFSKRYSTEQTDDANNAKLLDALYEEKNRSAFFHCSIAMVYAGGIHIVQGQCFGKIAYSAQGKEGFGYDPLFIPNGYPLQTFATLSQQEKNKISHRAQALQKSIPILKEILSR